MEASFTKGKMGFRLSLLAFSAWICVLTGASLATIDYYAGDVYIWEYPLLVFGWVFAFAFAYDFVLDKRGFGGKRLIILVFCLIIASSGVTHAVYIVGTPKWSFAVSTDESSYIQNETIHIAVTLKNLGYIPHSFPSIVDPPIIVVIWNADLVASSPPQPGLQVWYSVFVNKNQTTFTISPGQSFTRTFAWNQTYTESSVQIGPGTYIIDAFVPDPSSYPLVEPYLSPFWAETIINITSTS